MKWKVCIASVFLLFFSHTHSETVNAMETLANFLHQTARAHNVAIDVVSSINTLEQKQFIKALLNTGSAQVSISTLNGFSSRMSLKKRQERCPVSVIYEQLKADSSSYLLDPEKLFIRKKPYGDHFTPGILIFWIDMREMDIAVAALQDSALNCKQKIHPGLFHSDSRILFLTNNKTETNAVYKQMQIFRHPRVACLQLLGNSGLVFRQWGFVQSLHLIGDVLGTTKSARMFSLAETFEKYTFRAGCMPWAFYVHATLKPNDDSIYRYTNYWGLEIELLHILKHKLKFQVEMRNPEDGLWGLTEDSNGQWNGMVEMLVSDRADAIFSGFTISPTRAMVMDVSEGVDKDYLGWVSPNPEMLPAYLALVKPLHTVVWIMIVVAMCLVGTTINLLARTEGNANGKGCPQDWVTLKATVWYCFGTLLGEAITRDTKSEKLPALRLVIASWVLLCMIVGTSYSGNLKAYLSTPSFTQPIDTVSGIVQSGLKYEFMVAGEEEEIWFATSSNSDLRTIWKEKIVIPVTQYCNLTRVYNRETVQIIWISGLDLQVYRKYTRPGTGETLVYPGPGPFFYKKDVAYGMNKFTPWNERINEVFKRVRETGLMSQLKQRMLFKMRSDMITSGERPIQVVDQPVVSALTLADTLGTLMVVGVLLSSSLIVFIFEHKCSSYV